jgi:hypothetical protein
MSIVRRAVPHLIQIVTVLAVTGVCFWVAYQRQLPPSPLARKIAEASRLSYHVVTRSQGPRFEILGSEQILKIVSHAVLDPELGYDPRRTVTYGLRLKLMHEGRLLWQQDSVLDSRQSKTDASGKVWMHENAFTSRLDTELSDDRMLLVHLPEDAPAGSMLEITLLGEPEQALIRVYKYTERDETAQRRALHRLDESSGNTPFTYNTYAPWSLLSQEDKLDRLSHNFERMAPVGEAGMDFFSQSVFYTGFRSAVEELEGEKGLILERHRGLVLNVIGPTSLRMELRRLANKSSEPAMETSGASEVVRVRTVSVSPDTPAAGQQAGSQLLRWELLVPSSNRPEVQVLEIPAGLHSLHVFTTARTPVRLDVSGPPMSQFGTMPYLDYDEVERRLLPDERRLVVYETGPGKVSPMVGVFVPDDPRARILRADIRILIAPDPPGVADMPPLSSSRFQAGIAIEYLDGNERVISAEQQVIEAPYTPYERLERSDSTIVSVSDSVGLRMIAPAGAQWIRISASRDVAVRFYRFLEGEEKYQAPYSNVALKDAIWRYAPRDRRQWFHAAPSNAASLLEADQRTTLVAQVRLEPVGEEEGGSRKSGGPLPAVALTPLGRPEQHVIFEPVHPRRFPRLLAHWPAGVATRLTAAQPMRFRFDGRTRPRLDYVIPAEHLGKSLFVRVDGAVVATVRFTTTRGYWRLPRIAPGNHALELATDATGVELYLDRPPTHVTAGGPARFELLRRRTVYALGPGPLEVEVRKPAGKRIWVTMAVYAPWQEAREDVELRAILGGGVPQRVAGVPFSRITVADRTLPMPAAETAAPAVFTDRDERLAGYPRFITVPLGDDLVAGNHRIGFSVSGSRRLWARFFITHLTATPGEQALQSQFDADEAPFSGPVPDEGELPDELSDEPQSQPQHESSGEPPSGPGSAPPAAPVGQPSDTAPGAAPPGSMADTAPSGHAGDVTSPSPAP